MRISDWSSDVCSSDLLHLVDANDEDVATSYRIVRDELEAYGADLIDKPVIVALNKIDTLDDELIAALSAEPAAESGPPVVGHSGAPGAGLSAVPDKLPAWSGHHDPAAHEDAHEHGWRPAP